MSRCMCPTARSSLCLLVPLLALLAGCATDPGASASPKQDSAGAPPPAAFEIRELDETPAPTFQARPAYPTKFAKNKVTGSAVVEFIVAADGRVVGARAVSASQPEFGAAAVAAVERWRFTPGRKKGRAVATRMQVPIHFELDEPPLSETLGAALRAATTQAHLPAIDISRLDVMPTPRSQARPNFPAHLREKGVQGNAVIDIIVDVNGDVRNAFVLRATHPELGDAALAAVAQWKFKPGQLRGRVVNTHMQVPIVFTAN